MPHPHKDLKEGIFQINGRFLIDKRRNEIWDKERNEGNRLEPRLMKLLCLLADRRNETVTREYIIKEVWNEYPGANEGLNQAISFLRKQLDDDGKEMIKTLPKIGYSFHATISGVSEDVPDRKRSFRWLKPVAIGILSLCLLLFIVYYFNRKSTYISPEYIKEAAELSRLDSIHQAERMKELKAK